MIGRLNFEPRGRGSVTAGRLYGLPVFYAAVDPESFWAERRLKKAGRALRQEGVVRLLVPGTFERWSFLGALGLRPVETEGFVKAQSARLAVESLERRGVAPDRATVALRAKRVDRTLRQTAAELCPKVRNLVVDVPRGGGELAKWLRWEFGIPVLPSSEAGQVGLCFHPDSGGGDEVELGLYGTEPKLEGLALCAPELRAEDSENLPLLSALWEGGKLRPEDIKILDRIPGNTYNDTESIIMPTDTMSNGCK